MLHAHGSATDLGFEAPGPAPGPDPGPDPGQPLPLEPSAWDPEYQEDFVPYILLAVFLTAMAGLMSGLTLGLMSLDQVDIEILRRSGTERQKRLAQRIQPVLRRPHVLLVTLLVCNACAAEALPLVLDRLANPLAAVVLSVTVVLFFGEIIPQAACSRYGLQIGAYSAPFVRLLMLLTAPISMPVGWVLDMVLGDRHTALFRRAELKALVDIHREGQEFGGQLSADEVSIIKGALDMTHKTARDAMTPLDMVFMLPADAVLDEATLVAIMASGHSRIPVHRPGDRRAILGIMLVKELLLVDAAQGKTVGRQKVRSLPYVRADTPLYDMLKLFEMGRSHMAALMQLKSEAAQRRRKQNEEALMVNVDSMSDDPSMESEREEEEELLERRPTATADDFLFDPADFEPVGIITIEDVLEELLQAEILDETDQFVDNMRRTPINAASLMRSLPPHLRGVLGARALLPRIGGADFMQQGMGSAAGSAAARSGDHLDEAYRRRDLSLRLPTAAAAAPAGAAAAAAPDTNAAATPEGGSPAAPHPADVAAALIGVGQAAVGAGGAGLTSPGRPPRSPRTLGSGALSPVGRSQRGPAPGRAGGGGGSVHGGLLFKQGSVGAALVAEALRQEVAQQLAAASGAAGGGRGAGGRPRSRSRSPLPRTAGSRHSLSSPERGVAPAAPSGPGSAAGSARPGGPEQQQGEREQPRGLPPLFPGVRRTRSDLAASSGASTPRIVMPLPPPPARRSTAVSQRVQDQMDLLEPLLTDSRRTSGPWLEGGRPPGGSGDGSHHAAGSSASP